MPEALTQVQRDAVVSQATAIAAQQGITPEQALYNYAQQNGLSASDVDSYMGFPAGSTQNWAVQNGKVAAPQGNYNPGQAQSVAAPVASPISAAPASQQAQQAAEAVRIAQGLAAKSGKSAEEELWNYAQTHGIDAAGIDSYMGFAPGTAQNWAVQNGKVAAPQGNYNPGQAQSTPVATGQYNHGAQLTPEEIAQAKTWSEGRTGSEVMAQAKVLGLTPEQLGSIYGATGQAVQHDFGYGTQSGYNGTGSTSIYSNGAWAVPKPSASQQSASAPTPTTPTPTAPTPPSSPAYQMPVLNALYQAQQQRMTAPVPQFNFQSKGPLSAGVPQQAPVAEAPAGALTTAINGS